VYYSKCPLLTHGGVVGGRRKKCSGDSARRKTVSERIPYVADTARNGFCDGPSCRKLNWCVCSVAISGGAQSP
jgi:hypothetical protein